MLNIIKFEPRTYNVLKPTIKVFHLLSFIFEPRTYNVLKLYKHVYLVLLISLNQEHIMY